MEDLVPFLIFVVIALANLVKVLAEKKGRGKKRPTAASPAKPPRQQPTSIEEFFEKLAATFEPEPTELPDWPEDRERPDYLREMEEFEAAEAKGPSRPEFTATEPVEWQPPEPVPLAELMDQTAPLKTALQSVPAVPNRSGRVRTPIAPLLPGGGGRLDFRLGDRAALRKAVIASIVFSPPRAYGATFDDLSVG